VTLTFWLARPARIELLIRQEAPDCRVWGTFAKRGERGLNRVRFLGRIHGKRLPPGTYRIRAEAIRGDKENRLGAVAVVIASRSQEIARTRAPRSTCDSAIGDVTDEAAAAANALLRTDTDTGGDDPAVAAATAKERPRVAAGGDLKVADDKNSAVGSISNSVVGSISNAFNEAPRWLHPLMLAMLALAMIVLVLGTLPARIIPSAGAALFVSQRRPALLGAGIGLLGALAGLLGVLALAALIV
jgi:hypothetical protein